MTQRRRLGVIAVSLFSVELLSGCGGSGSTANSPSVDSVPAVSTAETRTTAAADLHELGRTYLRIVKPANDALDEFKSKAKSYNDNTTIEQMATDIAPVVAAYEKVDNDLLRVDWPPSVASDVKALVTADGALLGDLRAVDSQEASTIGNWYTQVGQDGGKSSAAAQIVRADLGLPPRRPSS